MSVDGSRMCAEAVCFEIFSVIHTDNGHVINNRRAHFSCVCHLFENVDSLKSLHDNMSYSDKGIDFFRFKMNK